MKVTIIITNQILIFPLLLRHRNEGAPERQYYAGENKIEAKRKAQKSAIVRFLYIQIGK